MIRNLFYTLLLVLSWHVSIGQTGPKLSMLTPPPPDVSALGKFGIIPVSHFTGIPNINYPIYTINEGNIILPISIMYYAGGIKVKEDASEVGLGWALSAGGCITSSVRGTEDFPGGFASRFNDVPDNPENNLSDKTPKYNLDGRYYIWENERNAVTPSGTSQSIVSGLSLSHNGSKKDYFYELRVTDESYSPDYSSDLYTISLCGKSYKFVFDNDFKPVVLGEGTLKIELINFTGSYPDWKITDEQGIVYYFTQRQINSTNSTDPYYVGNRTSLSVNTWHLTKIVSPVNGEVTFDYLYSTQEYIHPLPSFSRINLIGESSPHIQQSPDVWSTSYSIYEQLNLKKIKFSDGFIQFIYADERLDLQGARRLQEIEIRGKTGALVRKIKLDNNHYFISTGTPSTPVSITSYSNDNHTKRLKLESIIEADSLGLIKYKRTNYTYNEQTNLPPKLTMAIDHWGYYNGVVGELLPPLKQVYMLGANGANYYISDLAGSDRESNPNTMAANILTSITHATGGTTTFAFEPNQYITNETKITYQDSVSEIYKAPGSSNINASGFMDANGNIAPVTKFTGKKLLIYCRVDRLGMAATNDDLNILVYENGSFLRRIPTAKSSYESVLDSSVVMQEGRRYRVFFEPFSQANFNSWEVRLQAIVRQVSSTITNNTVTKYSGGLRVKSIEDYDPVSGKGNVRKYNYSNGTEGDIPIYLSKIGEDHYDNGSGGAYPYPQVNYFRYRYGQSIYPFSDGGDAAYFGYQNVEVSEEDNGIKNGVTEYSYNTSSNINFNTIQYYSNTETIGIANPIMAHVPSYPTGRGDLREEKHYSSIGSNLIPVSSDYYTYDRDNPDKIWQMVFTQGLSNYIGDHLQTREFKIYASHFSIPVYHNVLQKKDHIEYDVSGNEVLRNSEGYTYDKNNGHYQLIKKSYGTSLGDTLNVRYRYPQDYPMLSDQMALDSASAGIRLLQQLHVVTPVEVYKEKVSPSTPNSKKYFDGLINLFHVSQPVLKQVLVLENSSLLNHFEFSNISNGVFSKELSYTPRLRLTYDVQNRVNQQIPSFGVPVSYLWKGSLLNPIAQIINAKISDVFYENFEEYIGVGISSQNDAKTGQFSKTSGFGISLSGLSDGLYTLSYWKKESNGVWNLVVLDNVSIVGGSYNISIPDNLQIDDIRFYPKDAQITSYTYKPLVGMTSMMDPKGMTTTYEYDDFGRLKWVKDQNGNILKENTYHYKN